MTKISDGYVKMDWDADKAYFTEVSLGDVTYDRVIRFVSQEYNTNVGSLTVFFNPCAAFLWADNPGADDEGLYKASDMIEEWDREGYHYGFPERYLNYIPIAEYNCAGVYIVNQKNAAKYGLQEHVGDILARIVDLRPYGDILSEIDE